MSRHTSEHSEQVFTVTKILNKDDQKQNMYEKPKIKAWKTQWQALGDIGHNSLAAEDF